MSLEAQASLFGEGGMAPPARPTALDLQAVRSRLNRLLATLQGADTMPLSAHDVRMWQTVVPNMTRWLPDDEAHAVCSTFTRELARLGTSSVQD